MIFLITVLTLSIGYFIYKFYELHQETKFELNKIINKNINKENN